MIILYLTSLQVHKFPHTEELDSFATVKDQRQNNNTWPCFHQAFVPKILMYPTNSRVVGILCKVVQYINLIHQPFSAKLINHSDAFYHQHETTPETNSLSFVSDTLRHSPH